MKVTSIQNRRYYLWILLLALMPRLLWALDVPVVPVSDSNAYDIFAQNLAKGLGFGWEAGSPTAYWPVGTSFIYSLFYRAFGHTYVPITIFNIILGLLTIGLSIRLAERWFGPRVAKMTGILLAFWGSQIQFTTVLASEQIFTFLILLALAVWLEDHLNLWIRTGIVGTVLAMAAYVRPTALLIPILLLIIHYANTKNIVKSLTAVLVMFVLMGLLIAPWSIRNTQAFGQFTLISTNSGANLWMGNNPNSTGGYMDLPAETHKMNEAESDRYLKSLAIAHIKEQPVLFGSRIIKRIVDTYSRENISIAWNEPGLIKRYGTWVLLPLKILNQLYWMLMLGLGLVGIWLLGLQKGWFRALTHPTILFWGYFTAVHALIVAQDRYHFPSIPMIAILAGLTLITGLDWIVKAKQRKRRI